MDALVQAQQLKQQFVRPQIVHGMSGHRGAHVLHILVEALALLNGTGQSSENYTDV